ncbi:MAG: caspase family protein [Cyclobacteriaceae bacterium]|nr:caspase family protein [Cyclobacteriaceae bacterium]
MKSMRIISVSLLGLAWLTLTLSAFRPAAPPLQKHALIIAIGAYDQRSTGWQEISSQNDIPLIKSALQKQGFPDGNITVLQDAKADRAGILAALAALEQRVKAGDMVVIHFSSHGQQIPDNNGEEVDGYDEAIVAFGAPSTNSYYKRSRGADYDGSLHLRDEEVGTAINGVRSKIGKEGHVLVIMDACHSGTGTRGAAKTRGGVPPLDIPGGAVAPTGKAEDGGFGIAGEGAVKSRGTSGEMGKMILISGAQSQEVNYETEDDSGNGVGSLSYCVSKALSNMKPGTTTYRALFAQVLSEMAVKAPKQTPQIEGDIDYAIFGGNFVAQKKYFTATQLVDNQTIKINAGRLMNISEGLTVAVEKAGTPAPGKTPLATGKVTSVTNFEATVKLDKPTNIKNKVDVWVFATGQLVPDVKVKVFLDSLGNTELKAALAQAIGAMGMAEVSKGVSDITVKEESSRGVVSVNLRSTAYGNYINGDIPITANSTDEAVKAITDRIQNFAQGKMFKALNLESSDYDVRITRVIPSSTNKITDTLSYKTLVDKGNFVNVPGGTYIFLELTNWGDKVAYYNIVDIEPSGKINALLPRVQADGVQPPVTELMLNPGQKKVIPYAIRISPPYGNEVFKVIATGQAFDLASTIKAPTAATRGGGNPIQQLVGKSFNSSFSTRGADAEFSDEMGTNTSEFTFKIVKKP